MTDSLRLLMVEDQQELRDLIGEALRDAGITVDTADDGHCALRMLRENGPYDVVFSDIRMPNGMSGIELSEQVSQLLPQARIIWPRALPRHSCRRCRPRWISCQNPIACAS